MSSEPSVLEKAFSKLFRLFSDVQEGEAVNTALFLLNLFLILVAYYIIKTVREPLILATGGAEMKSYASGVQAIVLLGYVPLYSWFSSKVSRLKLIIGLTIFFVVCIEIFYGLAYLNEGSPEGDPMIPHLGFVFYVWVGIFSLSVIAQFWSFANDLFDEWIGTRLFPVIAIGATVGAPVGSAIAAGLFELGVGAYEMLQISAVILVAHLGIYWLLDRRLTAQGMHENAEESLGGTGGFKLVLESRYLGLIALLLILLNLVNTTGEYILGKAVLEAAQEAAAQSESVEIDAYIGKFYGEFFSVVNIVAVAIQALVVSRIVKYLGIAGILIALPVIAFGVYGLIAFGVGLTVLRWAKTAENATDYSVMNTAKAILWLPTSREEKYKAKQAIDTFFVRVGDVMSALVVFVGTTYLSFHIREFAITNVVLILVWGVVAWLLTKEYQKLADEKGIDAEDAL